MEEFDDPLTLFKDALPNHLTRDRYEHRLDLFFKFLEIDGDSLEQRSVNFTKKSKENPNWTTSVILKYIRMHKERAEKKEISTATLPNYYKPIKLFCEMNDITLNWKKITRGIPRAKRYSTDRIPTLEEIKQLIRYPDRRLKSAILVMMSSGIRIGAWDYLRLGDITPIEKNGKLIAAKIIVYRGEAEEYPTFITPEAYESLKEYMDFRKDHREKITEKSWVLRDEFDVAKSSRGIATIPKKLQSSGLKRLIERALWAQNLRKPLESGEKRHEFKTDHGFRKYFKTISEKHMKSLHVEMLMGHATGLADNYYRISDDEMLEEYMKAIPALSVYDVPIEFENEQIKNMQDEMMRLKFDFVTVLRTLKESKLISNEDIAKKFMTMQNHIKMDKDLIMVKDTDGQDIIF